MFNEKEIKGVYKIQLSPHRSIPIAEGYRGEHGYDIDKCRFCYSSCSLIE